MWEECRVPSNWRNAVLIPVPKKGDLKNVTIGVEKLYWMSLAKW